MNETKTTKIIVDNVGQQKALAFWQQFDNMQDKINNLQSKIDKAIDKINKQHEEDKKIFRANYDFKFILDFEEELLDILKEDK